jgi:sulfite reductase alpha subunit-like flavoprotein
MFPSANLSMQDVISCLPMLTPRFYSIGSSPIIDSKSIHIAFTVVEKETFSLEDTKRKTFRGLCTSWLESLLLPQLKDQNSNSMDNISIPIFLNHCSEFSGEVIKDRNLVMIGPGTGCVPFRSIVRHRASLQTENKFNCVLYLGFQNREHDFLYAEEWNDLKSKGFINQMFVAFSRDCNSKWRYVQDAMMDNLADIRAMLSDETYCFLVCGKSSILQGILDILKRVLHLTKDSNTSEDEVENFIDSMIANRRLVFEVWGQ